MPNTRVASTRFISISDATSWYVYVLPLWDATAFKVGYTTHPLQRLHSFARRFFERFDLHQARLLAVDCETTARAIEKDLKTLLDAARSEAPQWVNATAGGHTEWFLAAEQSKALEQLGCAGATDAFAEMDAYEFLRDVL